MYGMGAPTPNPRHHHFPSAHHGKSAHAIQRGKMSPDSALASDIFDQFIAASTFKSVLNQYRKICDLLRLRPTYIRHFYPKLKSKIHSWKAQALWSKFDKRASHKCYAHGKAASNAKVLIIGGGPCGLRAAIEAQLLGAKVVVVEKRDRFSRNNVLHLWPFVIADLKALGAKKFYGKFCAGAIDHISIRQLQCMLLKVALLLGVEILESVSFEELLDPPDDQDGNIGWHARFSPANHRVNQYEFNVLIGADGKRNTLMGFRRKEFRGKLAIAITANFINKHSEQEARVQELSGVAFIFNQKFFKELYAATGIDLENIVYYKDETHYFVMTAKKHSLINKGVILCDLHNTQELLHPNNVDRVALCEYAREAADFSTQYQLPHLDFAINHYGKPDIAMFDFTSMFAAENACRIVQKNGHKLLKCLVGDSLLEPFWPIGSGCARGFLSCFDSCWAIRSFSTDIDPLELIAERESIYRLLAQTTPENLSKDFSTYTLEPSSRYPTINLRAVMPYQVKHLVTTDHVYVLKVDGEDVEKDDLDNLPKKRKRSNSLTPTSTLISWCQKEVSSYDLVVQDISSSFKSGLIFCAILHRYRPDLLNFDSLDQSQYGQNNQKVFNLLQKEYGITPFQSGEEFSQCDVPDRAELVAYISQIHDIFRGEIPQDSLGEEKVLTSVSNFEELPIVDKVKNHDDFNEISERVVPSCLIDDSVSRELLRKKRRGEMDMKEQNNYDPSNRNSANLTEEFNDRVKDLEAKFTDNPRNNRHHKPKDLVRTVGRLDKNDWNVNAIERKIGENPKTIMSVAGKDKEKVPKWNRELYNDKCLNIEKRLRDNGEDEERIAKYLDIDASLKRLETKLREGSTLETGLRGHNKVSNLANQLSSKWDAKGKDAEKLLPRQTKPMVLPSGSTDFCFFCTTRVYLVERLSAEGKYFHRQCFKCCVCGVLLRLGNYIYDRDGRFGGKFFCIPHFGQVPSRFRNERGIAETDSIEDVSPTRKSYASKVAAGSKLDLEKASTPKYAKMRNTSAHLSPPSPLPAHIDTHGGDRGATPERAEFENSLVEASDEEFLSEDEWTDRNFGTSANELDDDDDDDDDSDYSDFSTDEEESSSDVEPNQLTADETRRLAETWKRRYSNGQSIDKDESELGAESDCYSLEYEAEGDESHTATEGELEEDEDCEEDVKAREKRKLELKNICVAPKKMKDEMGDTTDSDTEVGSSTDSDTEIDTDSEFDDEAPKLSMKNIPTIVIETAGEEMNPDNDVKIDVTENKTKSSPKFHEIRDVEKPKPDKPYVQNVTTQKIASKMLREGPEKSASTSHIPRTLINPQRTSNMRKHYLLGASTNLPSKSASNVDLGDRFKNFMDKISATQKKLNPAPEPSPAMQAFMSSNIGVPKERSLAEDALLSPTLVRSTQASTDIKSNKDEAAFVSTNSKNICFHLPSPPVYKSFNVDMSPQSALPNSVITSSSTVPISQFVDNKPASIDSHVNLPNIKPLSQDIKESNSRFEVDGYGKVNQSNQDSHHLLNSSSSTNKNKINIGDIVHEDFVEHCNEFGHGEDINENSLVEVNIVDAKNIDVLSYFSNNNVVQAPDKLVEACNEELILSENFKNDEPNREFLESDENIDDSSPANKPFHDQKIEEIFNQLADDAINEIDLDNYSDLINDRDIESINCPQEYFPPSKNRLTGDSNVDVVGDKDAKNECVDDKVVQIQEDNDEIKNTLLDKQSHKAQFIQSSINNEHCISLHDSQVNMNDNELDESSHDFELSVNKSSPTFQHDRLLLNTELKINKLSHDTELCNLSIDSKLSETSHITQNHKTLHDEIVSISELDSNLEQHEEVNLPIKSNVYQHDAEFETEKTNDFEFNESSNSEHEIKLESSVVLDGSSNQVNEVDQQSPKTSITSYNENEIILSADVKLIEEDKTDVQEGEDIVLMSQTDNTNDGLVIKELEVSHKTDSMGKSTSSEDSSNLMDKLPEFLVPVRPLARIASVESLEDSDSLRSSKMDVAENISSLITKNEPSVIFDKCENELKTSNLLELDSIDFMDMSESGSTPEAPLKLSSNISNLVDEHKTSSDNVDEPTMSKRSSFASTIEDTEHSKEQADKFDENDGSDFELNEAMNNKVELSFRAHSEPPPIIANKRWSSIEISSASPIASPPLVPHSFSINDISKKCTPEVKSIPGSPEYSMGYKDKMSFSRARDSLDIRRSATAMPLFTPSVADIKLRERNQRRLFEIDTSNLYSSLDSETPLSSPLSESSNPSSLDNSLTGYIPNISYSSKKRDEHAGGLSLSMRKEKLKNSKEKDSDVVRAMVMSRIAKKKSPEKRRGSRNAPVFSTSSSSLFDQMSHNQSLQNSPRKTSFPDISPNREGDGFDLGLNSSSKSANSKIGSTSMCNISTINAEPIERNLEFILTSLKDVKGSNNPPFKNASQMGKQTHKFEDKSPQNSREGTPVRNSLPATPLTHPEIFFSKDNLNKETSRKDLNDKSSSPIPCPASLVINSHSVPNSPVHSVALPVVTPRKSKIDKMFEDCNKRSNYSSPIMTPVEQIPQANVKNSFSTPFVQLSRADESQSTYEKGFANRQSNLQQAKVDLDFASGTRSRTYSESATMEKNNANNLRPKEEKTREERLRELLEEHRQKEQETVRKMEIIEKEIKDGIKLREKEKYIKGCLDEYRIKRLSEPPALSPYASPRELSLQKGPYDNSHIESAKRTIQTPTSIRMQRTSPRSGSPNMFRIPTLQQTKNVAQVANISSVAKVEPPNHIKFARISPQRMLPLPKEAADSYHHHHDGVLSLDPGVGYPLNPMQLHSGGSDEKAKKSLFPSIKSPDRAADPPVKKVKKSKDRERRRSLIQVFTGMFSKSEDKKQSAENECLAISPAMASPVESPPMSFSSAPKSPSIRDRFSKLRLSRPKEKSRMSMRSSSLDPNAECANSSFNSFPSSLPTSPSRTMFSFLSSTSKEKADAGPHSDCEIDPLYKGIGVKVATSSPPPPVHSTPSARRQKATLRAAKQQENKRLRMAQEIQRQLEECEVKTREVEDKGVRVEKTLQDSTDSHENVPLVDKWYALVHEKNTLNRWEQELHVRAREIDLEDRHSRLESELRQRMASKESEKSQMDIEREGIILAEMLAILEEKDGLLAQLEEDRQRYVIEDQQLDAISHNKGGVKLGTFIRETGV